MNHHLHQEMGSCLHWRHALDSTRLGPQSRGRGAGGGEILCIQSYQQKYRKNLFERAATYWKRDCSHNLVEILLSALILKISDP